MVLAKYLAEFLEDTKYSIKWWFSIRGGEGRAGACGAQWKHSEGSVRLGGRSRGWEWTE